MRQYENDCVGCELPCLGNSCPYAHVLHAYCNECGAEIDVPDGDEEEDLCEDCKTKSLADDYKAFLLTKKISTKVKEWLNQAIDLEVIELQEEQEEEKIREDNLNEWLELAIER